METTIDTLDPDLLQTLFEKVLSGEWLAVAAIGVVLAVYLTRRFVAPRIPFLLTDHGGAILALAGGILGGVSNAVLAGNEISFMVVQTGVTVGFVAAGGYATVKKIGSWILGLVFGKED